MALKTGNTAGSNVYGFSTTGGAAWSNVNNALVADGAYATGVIPAGTSSTPGDQELVFGGFNFAIPDVAVINSIDVTITGYADVACSALIRAVVGPINTTSLSNFSVVGLDTSTLTIPATTAGSPSVNIGVSAGVDVSPINFQKNRDWAVSDFNDPNFRIFVVFTDSNGDALTTTVNIDVLTLNVNYTITPNANTGWHGPNVASQNTSSGGTAPWSNINNIKKVTPDASSYSTIVTPSSFTVSQQLLGSDFGLSIPVGAIVTGLEVRATTFKGAGGTFYGGNFNFGTADQADAVTSVSVFANTTATTVVAGSSTSFPGNYTYTRDQLNNSSLFIGVVGFAQSLTLYVDSFQVRASYYLPGALSYTNTGTSSQAYSMTYGGITTTPYRYSTTAVSSGGTTQWINPSNANVSDDVKSTLTFPGTTGTTAANRAYLNTTGYGFSIPTGSTILGIQVGVEQLRSGGSTGDTRLETVQLTKSGTLVGTNKGNTTNSPTIEALTIFGGSNDLWGTTWTAEEVNAIGMSVRPNGSTTTTNRVLNIDSVPIMVTYVQPAASGVSLIYNNSGTGSQSYSVYNSTPQLSYNNTGTGAQSYQLRADTMFAYLNSGSGNQNYVLSAAQAIVYTNSGVGSQNYALSASAALSYNNSGVGTQAYTLRESTSLVYNNTGTGSQAYVLKYNANFAYTNSGTGTQSYQLITAAGFGYNQGNTGSQNYVLSLNTKLSYSNTGAGSQSYMVGYRSLISYLNTGKGTQNYVMSFAGLEDKPTDGVPAGRGRGRLPTEQHSNAPRELKKRKLVKAIEKAIEVEEPKYEDNIIAELAALREAELIAEQIELERLELLAIAEAEALRIQQEIEEDEIAINIILMAAKEVQRSKRFLFHTA